MGQGGISQILQNLCGMVQIVPICLAEYTHIGVEAGFYPLSKNYPHMYKTDPQLID